MRVVFGADLTYFYWSCATGVILAAFYDILRVKRKIVKPPDFLVNIEDILYLILFGIIVIYTAYEKNNGNLRFYGIITTAAVSVLYRLALGNYAVRFFSFIIQTAAVFAAKILRFLTAPFRIIYKKVLSPIFQAALRRPFEKLKNSLKKVPKKPYRR